MYYKNELALAIRAVRKASLICESIRLARSEKQILYKVDRSPVTLADMVSQVIINLEIREVFPDDCIIAEEDTAVLKNQGSPGNEQFEEQMNDWLKTQRPNILPRQVLQALEDISDNSGWKQRTWIIDPLDGTQGFLKGGQYAVALALFINGELILGVLGCPLYNPFQNPEFQKGSVFYAIKGNGSFAHPLYADFPQKVISVNGITDIRKAVFCESRENYLSRQEKHAQIASHLGITTTPSRIDSQVKYAAVACGDVSIYMRFGNVAAQREKIWDHAPGSIIVEEAKGCVTDFMGNPIDFSVGVYLNSQGILATNRHLHREILMAIQNVMG